MTPYCCRQRSISCASLVVVVYSCHKVKSHILLISGKVSRCAVTVKVGVRVTRDQSNIWSTDFQVANEFLPITLITEPHLNLKKNLSSGWRMLFYY